MGYLTLHCGIPCIALWDTLSHDPAQQSIQMESCDSLALGLRRSAMDCAGAAQVFPHRRFNRALSCDGLRDLRCYTETRLKATALVPQTSYFREYKFSTELKLDASAVPFSMDSHIYVSVPVACMLTHRGLLAIRWSTSTPLLIHSCLSVCHSPVDFCAHSRAYPRSLPSLSAPICAYSRSLLLTAHMHKYLWENDKSRSLK